MYNSSTSGISAKSADSWRNVMVPVNEGVLKRITRTFFESGFTEALNEARDPATAASSPLISSTAEFTHRVLEFIKKLKVQIFPHMREHGIASIAKYSETRYARLKFSFYFLVKKSAIFQFSLLEIGFAPIYAILFGIPIVSKLL